MNFVIGDIHDGEQDIITYNHRPFISVEDMHNAFVNNWNKTLSDDDIGWIIGDIGNIKILQELRGKINIVIGNHDNYKLIRDTYPYMFVSPYPVFVDRVWLSHEPFTFIPPELPYLNVHAHTHIFSYGLIGRNWADGNRYFCASAEQIGYTPISFREITERIGYK